MATHSSILAWRIPWIGEPGGLQSMGSQRVRHNWVTEHARTHAALSVQRFILLGRDFCHGTSSELSEHVSASLYNIERSLAGCSPWVHKESDITEITQYLSFCIHAKSLRSYPILCDPIDCSPPGSSIHGILQARILEWIVIPFSKGSS